MPTMKTLVPEEFFSHSWSRPRRKRHHNHSSLLVFAVLLTPLALSHSHQEVGFLPRPPWQDGADGVEAVTVVLVSVREGGAW